MLIKIHKLYESRSKPESTMHNFVSKNALRSMDVMYFLNSTLSLKMKKESTKCLFRENSPNL